MTQPAPPTAGAPRVWVVCSLYRPGAHLDRQLESILDQSHADLRVLLRDDAGEGEGARRIAEWARRDARVEPLEASAERIGTASSYGLLLEAALARGAEWVALADQDDEWRPDHLSRSLEIAARHTPGRAGEPMLVHGDLELIDERGETIAPSLFAHQHIRHEKRDPLRVLVVQNFVTGCATLANRALVELAVPIVDAAIMHDWWLALCAAATGRLLDREATTVRYRQHATNQIGAVDYGDVVRELGRRTLRLQRHANDELHETVRQSEALRARLRERLEGALPPRSAERCTRSLGFLDRYLDLYEPGQSRLRRSFGLWQLGVRRQDPLLDLSLKTKMLTADVTLEPGEHEERRG